MPLLDRQLPPVHDEQRPPLLPITLKALNLSPPQQLSHVALLDHQLPPVHDEQRPAGAARVGEQTQLLQAVVVDQADLVGRVLGGRGP